MTYEEIILKETVMRRVRCIHAIKTVAVPLAAKFAVAAALVAFAAFFVSVPNVVRNMPSVFEAGNFVRFAGAAFLNTKAVIQAASIGMFILVAGMAFDVVKIFRSPGVLAPARR